MTSQGLLTTTTGSFPRPAWLAATDITRARFGLSGPNLDEALDDATDLVIRQQEDLGIDIVTDGEMRREGFIFQAAKTWDGIDLVNLGTKHIYRNRPVERQVPKIVGPIKRLGPSLPTEARSAKRYATHPLKVAIAGPLTIVDSTIDEHYGDEAALAMDAAIAINEELIALQNVGVEYLQIDEPAMTRYHDKVDLFGAAALDRCLEGITVPVFVHLCYGYPGTKEKHQHHITYPRLLDRLMQTRISGFTVEFGRSPFNPSLLAPYSDRYIMFGCIDPGDSPPPEVDKVKRLVEAALEYIDPRKLFLAPDCGLMTISRDLARAKLTVMVEAARQLRQQI